jgi:phosphoribosylanthranilate isomerase
MLVKICGIKDKNTAQLAVEAGADALGFVFAPSPRQVTPHVAKKIIQSLPEAILKVGVFVNASISLVRDIARYCSLTTLQFHGQEGVDHCLQYRLPIIKAIKVTEKGRFIPDPGRYRGIVKLFLADTYQKDKEGGTGKTLPWEKIDSIKKYGSVILAGGLRPDNVYRALTIARPWGVDVSSGVETEGVKDIRKIRKFIQEVRRWKNENSNTR